MTLPLWVILAIVVGTAAAVKAVRVWLVVVTVLLGIYLATTGLGQTARNTIDHITHQSPTPTSVRSTR